MALCGWFYHAGHIVGCCYGICNSNFYVCGKAKPLLSIIIRPKLSVDNNVMTTNFDYLIINARFHLVWLLHICPREDFVLVLEIIKTNVFEKSLNRRFLTDRALQKAITSPGFHFSFNQILGSTDTFSTWDWLLQE